MAVVQQQGTPRVGHGPGTPTLVLMALITAAVVIGGVALWENSQDGISESAPSAVVATEPASIFTAEEEIMMKLAVQGYIPMEAVDWDAIHLKEAVAQGLVPEQALRPYLAPYEPIFSSEELATIELAEKGLIPMQTVDWDDVELRRLIAKGLIPRQAAP